MFSYEIEEKIKNEEFILSSRDYIDICKTSPQISRVKYSPYNDMFEMWTNDNFYWQFKVTIKK